MKQFAGYLASLNVSEARTIPRLEVFPGQSTLEHLKPWPNGTPHSSQLEPRFQLDFVKLASSWLELGVPFGQGLRNAKLVGLQRALRCVVYRVTRLYGAGTVVLCKWIRLFFFLKIINHELCFRILANYVVWNVIQDEVSFLSKKFRDARTKYRERILGSKGEKKRWKTCVTYSNELLGDILGSHYIRQHFSKSRKEWVSQTIHRKWYHFWCYAMLLVVR